MLNIGHVEEDHIATGSESLREFAHNAGMDNPDRCWLLDGRDVWVRNPYFKGPEEPHPEFDMYREMDMEQEAAAKAEATELEQDIESGRYGWVDDMVA